MKKLIYLLTFYSLIYSGSLRADSTTDFLEELNSVIDEVTNAPSDPCHDCAVENNTISLSDPLPTKYVSNGRFFNNNCKNFIRDDGSEGDWGEMITSYIDSSRKISQVYLNDEIKGMTAAPYTCPNWYDLNKDQRKRFWIWMFASIAQVESSCDPTVVNTGIVPDATDRPTGLFQLNRKLDKRSWRGPNCRFPSGYDETIKIENQIRCSMDIMYEVLKGSKGAYRSNGKIFPANTYWEKLRPNHSQTGGPIGELIRQYPPCGSVLNSNQLIFVQ